MALRRTLAGRFLHLAKLSSPDPQIRPPPNSPFLLRRRLLQRRPVVPPDRLLLLPSGDRLLDRIRGINPDRIRLGGISPPPAEKVKDETAAERGITVEEARKVLRASQMEAARARLRAIPMSCIPYSDFLQICRDASGGEQGAGIARSLDEAGAVIVLGNAVFLRPESVAKAIENVIPLSMTQPNDPRRKELREMEEKKAEIDRKAVARVRRELWCGLGFLVMQTVGFMRLTFWELSWDVMEPICFYVTSVYFMAGYFFFLRTSKDPSFEGFFENRFAAKQKRLMKVCNFDLHRFNELRTACPLPSPSSPSEEFPSSACMRKGC
ncbi:calcium uniporter protein 2, mitochondrial-like [Phoenix dactylifera]|uniref:Calcium uniporter protein 2, mitochondrial-like n=1 Tax=Phoenix dactylifera TaxID=42345 RepID=A0A8B7CDI0_PHODC|nr:calcium uniporter protein 2, mitochondrial-like [Phoenix dactylifera]